jgi:hypothetical protein
MKQMAAQGMLSGVSDADLEKLRAGLQKRAEAMQREQDREASAAEAAYDREAAAAIKSYSRIMRERAAAAKKDQDLRQQVSDNDVANAVAATKQHAAAEQSRSAAMGEGVQNAAKLAHGLTLIAASSHNMSAEMVQNVVAIEGIFKAVEAIPSVAGKFGGMASGIGIAAGLISLMSRRESPEHRRMLTDSAVYDREVENRDANASHAGFMHNARRYLTSSTAASSRASVIGGPDLQAAKDMLAFATGHYQAAKKRTEGKTVYGYEELASDGSRRYVSNEKQVDQEKVQNSQMMVELARQRMDIAKQELEIITQERDRAHEMVQQSAKRVQHEQEKLNNSKANWGLMNVGDQNRAERIAQSIKNGEQLNHADLQWAAQSGFQSLQQYAHNTSIAKFDQQMGGSALAEMESQNLHFAQAQHVGTQNTAGLTEQDNADMMRDHWEPDANGNQKRISGLVSKFNEAFDNFTEKLLESFDVESRFQDTIRRVDAKVADLEQGMRNFKINQRGI